MIERPDSPLVNNLHGSANFGARQGAGASGPDMLILHYTGMHSCAKAIEWLADARSNVSCHYVVDEDGTITQMVSESQRAWHAGAGAWAGHKDINSLSVGIEIHNLGHELGYPDFPEDQIAAVEALARDIVTRQDIAPARVLAHSDVAPLRKGDPGEKFPWARLAEAGVGLWVEPASVDEADEGLGYFEKGAKSGSDLAVAARAFTAEQQQQVAEARMLMAQFGYEVEQSAVFDLPLHKTLLAFQRHFRPARCDGRLDGSTMATLRQLVAKL